MLTYSITGTDFDFVYVPLFKKINIFNNIITCFIIYKSCIWSECLNHRRVL